MLPYVTVNYYLYTKQDILVTGYPRRLCPAEPFVNIYKIYKIYKTNTFPLKFQKSIIKRG